jgi:hypothetical protein
MDATDEYVQQVMADNEVAGIAYEREDIDPIKVREFKGSAAELFELACTYEPGSA